jgi:hypothetical protein
MEHSANIPNCTTPKLRMSATLNTNVQAPAKTLGEAIDKNSIVDLLRMDVIRIWGLREVYARRFASQ